MRKKQKNFFKKFILTALASALLITGLPLTAGTAEAVTLKQESRSGAGMDAETAKWIEEAGEALTALAAERDIMAVVYLSDTFQVRSLPSHEGDEVVTVFSGQQVNILDVYVDDAGEVWEYVKLEYQGNEFFGYIPRANLASSDARFLEWESNYGMNPSATVYAIDAGGERSYPDIEQFPESYRPALLALKQKHPNWIFAKLNTTLNWDNVIYNQLQGGKSLVYKTFPDWAKNGLYDSGDWYYATKAALELCMDPRNALHEDAIFQFEQLTYNPEYHTEAALESFLNNTFMNSSAPAPGTVLTYTNIFHAIGREAGREVSPFHLAARVYQEQGQGTSPLISGNYPGYEGYYNYFNIAATGTTDKAIFESGLSYAKSKNWNNAYASILGGSDFISANYIKKGQDTLYLQKYNVKPGAYHPLHTHQYMQNIYAPTSEGASIKKLYASAGALESPFVFTIPVYENMPAEPCGVPTPDTKVSVAVPGGYNSAELWLDGVAYAGTLKDGVLTVSAPDSNAKTAVMYRYDEAGIPTGMYAWSLKYDGYTYAATAEPELENLLSYHGFSIRITGKSGIRFKTGISVDLRNRLTSSGVNGYRLKEYGGLVMSENNRKQYPMIKDGAKVISGMSYGTDSNGNRQDTIYETVDGRHRYTSVLVGTPVEQYKTEYAFRGYIILEKNGVTYTFYGAPLARSIYNLAGQLLDRGIYAPGTDVHEFLKKLISDADALTAAGDTANAGDAAAAGDAANAGDTVSAGDAAN